MTSDIHVLRNVETIVVYDAGTVGPAIKKHRQLGANEPTQEKRGGARERLNRRRSLYPCACGFFFRQSQA